MSLRDTSCYTLTTRPSESHANVIELVEHGNGTADTVGKPKYARALYNVEGEAYSAAIYGKSASAARR